ncbi:hypothetical protein CEXT_177501 [Caerostris extrusa]|uniref:Uncharacterized protein n=1 Tax=Caerostris extrusa TaxID=172846 RepID=A0AAV4VRS1_CAEEX|nr:hypothetical protein CEXT_177501 [Caerostris extrusa]
MCLKAYLSVFISGRDEVGCDDLRVDGVGRVRGAYSTTVLSQGEGFETDNASFFQGLVSRLSEFALFVGRVSLNSSRAFDQEPINQKRTSVAHRWIFHKGGMHLVLISILKIR